MKKNNVLSLFKEKGVMIGFDKNGTPNGVGHSEYITGIATDTDTNTAFFTTPDEYGNLIGFEQVPIRIFSEMIIQWLLLNDPEYLDTYRNRGDWVAKRVDKKPK